MVHRSFPRFHGRQLPTSRTCLTVLLLPAFFQLYLRFRDSRTLLWFLGFFFAVLRMLQFYDLGWWNLSDSKLHPWWAASSAMTAILISSALFLASLSPQGFRVGRFRILYAVPFTIPLIAYAFLMYCVYGGVTPGGFPFLIFPALGALSLLAGCAFGPTPKGSLPTGLALALCIVLGGMGLWICVRVGGAWPLVFVECAIHATTALLVFYVFRRFSPGTISCGPRLYCVVAQHWCHSARLHSHPGARCLPLPHHRAGKSCRRHRHDPPRSRRSARRQAGCAKSRTPAPARNSRLTPASLFPAAASRTSTARRLSSVRPSLPTADSRRRPSSLLQTSGHYRLAGAAGFDDATVNALEALATRIPGRRIS